MKKDSAAVTFKGVGFLSAVMLAYGIVLFWNVHVWIGAVGKAVGILRMLLPIFLFIIVLMALLNYFFNPAQLIRHLGKESGAKGWFWAIGAGLLSHGPMYAWYPMIGDLRIKGARDGLIAAFFYSRAIKLPLLPLMVDYFGLAFTVVLSLYIIIASFIQGWLLEVLE